MKNFHKSAVLLGVLAVLFGAGCGGVEDVDALESAPSTLEEPADVGAGGEVQALCQFGSYWCPSTMVTYDYSTPGCGGDFLKPGAYTACERACPVACKDTGWHSY